ncbi:uncharacterized protein LOC131683469 isoform X2 [Topomyia yanbarensis]|uniref:uncharacterized protein LOC131683469 isoform X2 n=1 Tax=Topomyia yanbarensis TaxID=2498891 RepID=UPI00273A7C40|nr:uncharacterized protein LOC131683469 isoform X2 [Topomyia yanbarensis]
MFRLLLLLALLASPTLTQKADKRRAFYRRSTTTTAVPVPDDDDIGSTEAKQSENQPGEGLYTVSDSFAISGGSSSSSSSGDSIGKGSSFKPITTSGDKQTSFAEYNFGGTKLSDTSDSSSDEDYGFKNHKAHTSTHSNGFKPSGTFDFLNNDYTRTSLDTKPKTSVTSKFSISHPTPTKTSFTGRLDYLDDSTEYDVYSNLKTGSHYKALQKNLAGATGSPFSTFSGSSLSFDGKVKKLPPSYEDYGLGSTPTKHKKNKLSLDDDTFGGTGSYGIGSTFGVGKIENFFSSGGKKKNPYGFGEPPLVKSAVSTLKHFGEGLLGKPEKASSYDYDSDEGGFGSQKFKPFGKGGSLTNNFQLDDSDESDEHAYVKQKFPKPHSSYGPKPQKPITPEYESDFDVKNIKLPGAHNNFRPHTRTKHTQHKSKQHGSAIDNPNPLEFRPNFKLQDVPNLYPDEHIGAGIAAKGQIENFLNSEHAFKGENIRTTHYLDGHPGKKPTYQQYLKSQEDEKLEKEALKAQIEYLKAQAAKRPAELRQRPPGPAPFPQHSLGPAPSRPRGRPVRRIPGAHVPLGVKGPGLPPRIPHYNDRPYSISFKL